MVRTTLGAEVDTTVSVSGSESVEFIRADITQNVPAGTTITTTFRPPPGTIYEILTARLRAEDPGGTNSQTHSFRVSSEVEGIGLLSARATGDTRIDYQNGTIEQANTVQKPPSVETQQFAFRNLRIDNSAGIIIEYLNFSGATNTSDVKIRFAVREIKVSK